LTPTCFVTFHHVVAYFGWLDGDDSQRDAMLEVIKLFEDSSTVDELGIGSVRDTFSNAFFPGTSTLHTRARYLLFVAWLVNDVARHRWPTERAQAELRSRETKLIHALLAGGEDQGVIGRDAKGTLKTMPSGLYWASLEHLGVRHWRTSIGGYFRNAVQHRRITDDPDADLEGPDSLGMTALPPAPAALLDATSFDLDRTEAEYLRIRIAESTRGTALAWLAVNHPQSEATWLWEHEALGDFPAQLRDLVDHARRVYLTATGPAILYNVMMAELIGHDEHRETYAELLDQWAQRLDDEAVLRDWDRSRFWQVIRQHNPRIRPSTQRFLEEWWRLAGKGQHASEEARSLVTVRELNLKRGRARLTYPEARSTWGVGAGTGALDFRWSIARGHLNDIAAGLEA
jgi:hypothetical protein